MKHDRRVDDNDSLDAIGIVRRKENREQSAKGMAAHDHLAQSEIVEKCDHVSRVISHRIIALGLGCTPTPAKIRCDNPMLLCKAFVDQPAEFVCIRGEPMKEDDRRLRTWIVEIVNTDVTKVSIAVEGGAIVDFNWLRGHTATPARAA